MNKQKTDSYKIIASVILVIWGFMIAYPFYNVIIVSLQTRIDFIQNPLSLFPKQVIWDSYTTLFQNDAIYDGFKVTLFVVIVGVIYGLLLTTMLAYALSRPKFPGKSILTNLIIFTMYFGGGLVPFYIVIQKLHLINNILGLVLPVSMNTFYLMIMITHFKNLPISLFESASIDGANDIYILFKIALPISVPMIATVSLFYAVDRWNDWFLGMLIINDFTKFPLQLVLKTILTDVTSNMSSQAASALQNSGKVFDQGVRMACVVITTIPVLIFYPFVQRFFVGGIMVGSIKA